MTVGGIIFGVILTVILLIVGVLIAVYCVGEEQWVGLIATIILGVGLIAGTWIGLNWYYGSTEAGKRAIKTQDSNFNGGITREVTVYDMDGDVLAHYKGKFDVEYSDERILFDDENGQRHIIYFKSGTVVVDEVSE